ncbi:MAG: M48 family metallopeptidase [Rhodospirillales bacterium]
MIFSCSRLLCLFAASVVISACQTTGTSKWVPAGSSAADISTAENHILAGQDAVGAQDINFEIGKNPYAYKDIPPGVRPALDTREAGIWLQLDKIEEKQKSAGNRVQDEKLNSYLTEIACKMSGPYCQDVRVYTQRIPLFNATMAPNGMMTIYTGFLLRTQNEAQLASVLGHEVGHYIRRHSIQGLDDTVAKSDFSAVFGILAAGMGAPGVADLMNLALISSQFSFNRDHEREADLIGINLLHLRGYDTREAANVWKLLVRERDPDKDPDEVSTSTSFSSTHPSDGERLKSLTAISNKLQGPDKWGVTNEERFDKIVGPWKFRFLQDEVRLRNWKNSLALLEILEEYGHDKAEIAFFQGEIYRNRDKKADEDAEDEDDRIADIDRALKAYEKCLALPGTPAEAYRAAGLIYHKKSNHEKSRAALNRYLQLKPNAKDRKLIQYMINNSGSVSS